MPAVRRLGDPLLVRHGADRSKRASFGHPKRLVSAAQLLLAPVGEQAIGYIWSTDSTLPAGSVNHAIGGPSSR